MVKAVFTSKVTPDYDDLPEQRYHFPKAYFNQVQKALGDFIIYYEPRRSTANLSSHGGRKAYFAFARVVDIQPDPATPDHFYAFVEEYLDFSQAVPFAADGRYLEGGLQKADGTTNKGAFGRAVRNISDDEFSAILKRGYTNSQDEALGRGSPSHAPPLSLQEPDTPFERPIIERMISRPFRERSFMHNVRSAYSNRCAMTGLSLLDDGGRPEVQAAHIRPVAMKGPDSVRNGLALTGTAHWMFDRGLISIAEDYKILVAKDFGSSDAQRLLNSNRQINLPKDHLLYPNEAFLRFHRETIFRGA